MVSKPWRSKCVLKISFFRTSLACNASPTTFINSCLITSWNLLLMISLGWKQYTAMGEFSQISACVGLTTLELTSWQRGFEPGSHQLTDILFYSVLLNMDGTTARCLNYKSHWFRALRKDRGWSGGGGKISGTCLCVSRHLASFR